MVDPGVQDSPIRPFCHRALRALLIILSFGTAALFAQEHEGKIVDRITASSNINVPLAKIKGVMSLREGEPFSSARLKNDFRSIWNLGFFRDLRIELTPVSEDRVALNVVVEERYRVRSIRFAGAVKYAEQTLLDELPLKIEDYYSPAAVNKAVNQVKDKYRSSGYLMTRVKTEVKTLEKKKEVEILFEVVEGAEMVVGQIRFFGNSNLTADALRKDMELHEDKWYREGKYDDLLLEKDKEKILYAYKKAGYVNAKLIDTKVGTRWRDPAKKDVREVLLDFTVTEGEKYFFGDITLRGAKLFTETELRKTLRRKAGEVFNQEIHDGDLATLAKLYQERGYIFSRVTPVETLDPKTKKLHFVFDIYEGEKAHVERIFIAGNEKTKDFVIRRELEIQEGEVFNTTKIRRSFERIMNLQFFKNVAPDYRPGSAEGLMNLIFNVEEQRTGIISAGLGLGTATGVSFNAEVRENNFRGLGQTLGFKLTFGERQKLLSLNFTEPWVIPKGPQITLGASLSASLNVTGMALPNVTNGWSNISGTNTFVSNIPNNLGILVWDDVNGNRKTNSYISDLGGQMPYTSSVFNLSVFASTRLGYWYVVGLNNAFEIKRDFFDSTFPIDSTLPSQKELSRQSVVRQQFETRLNALEDGPWKPTYTVSWSLNRDTRDNNLNPTRGTLVKGTMDWVFIQNNMTRFNFQFSGYQKFLKYFVFAWQTDLWTLGNPLFGDFNVEYDQLYSFSREEMRGWEYLDVRTFRDELQKDARNRSEGRNYITADTYNSAVAKVRHGMEIRFPIAEQVLWGLWFFDMGTLSANRISLDTPRGYDFIVPFSRPLDRWLQEYMFDTGIGLRLQIPAFPIRLYLSWKFKYDPGNNSWGFYRQDLKHIFFQKDENDGTGIPIYAPTFVLNIFGFF